MKSAFTLLSLFFSIAITSAQAPFVTTWQTDNAGTSCNSCITIPTHPQSTYNYEVDWDNDGVYDESGITGSVTHDFGTPGTYTIAIRGDFPRIYFNDEGDYRKILQVNQWGDIQWQSMARAFRGCRNLNGPMRDTPNLSQVTDMSYMFAQATSFNQDIGGWDVSNVSNMERMFDSAINFNQRIGGWDVSEVSNMRWMFWEAVSFNQYIGNWDVSNVTNMSGMFQDAIRFNQAINNWDVSNVNDMSWMFGYASSFK